MNGIAAIRYDAGKLGKLERTGSGGVRIPASLARTGVLRYVNADGTERLEYRPPEEVFHADALRSFDDVAVTITHPSTGKVTPETYRRDAVGHVRPGVRRDGDLVAGELAVQDAPAIDAIDRGDLVELSAGYDVLYYPTPGVTDAGERYDGVQRSIRANHVALLPRGGGRSGREVALRLDSNAAIQIEGSPACAPVMRNDMSTTNITTLRPRVRIDGLDLEMGSPEHLQALEKRIAELEARNAKMDAEAEEAKKAAEAAETKATEEKARADAAEKRVKELLEELSPAKIEARAASRASLIERVRPVLGAETKLDGLTEHEIKAAALAKLDPQFKLDAIAEAQRETYVNARFDGEMRHAGERSPLDQGRADALPLPTTQPRPTGSAPTGRGLPGVVARMQSKAVKTA